MALQDIDRPADTSSVAGVHSLLATVRFAVLWLIAGCAMAGTMTVFFYEPGVLEEGVAGEMEGDPVTMGLALLMAAMVALPLVMAAVTLFLPARANGVANLVVGVLVGAFGLFTIVTHLADGALHAHLTLVALATVIAGAIAGLSVAELRRLSHGDGQSATASISSEDRAT